MISKERTSIYRKLRKLGFHTTSSLQLSALHRWTIRKEKPLIIKHDVIQIYCTKSKKVHLTIMSEYLYISLKKDQKFNINNFNLSDYDYSAVERSTTLNKEEIKLINDLYNEIMIENGINEKMTCDTCKHKGHWENEIEYGYNSPCTNCSIRAVNNWEGKKDE